MAGLIQQTTGSGKSLTSLNLTNFLAFTTVGNVLVLCVHFHEVGSGTIPQGTGIGGAAGTGWTRVAQSTPTLGRPTAEIWIGSAAGGRSLTVVPNVSATITANCQEWNGYTSANDGVTAKSTASQTSPFSSAPGSITTANASDLIIAFEGADNVETITDPTSPWNALTSVFTTGGSGGSNNSTGFVYQIVSSSGTFNPSFSFSGSSAASAGAIVALPAASAGTPDSYGFKSERLLALRMTQRSAARRRLMALRQAAIHPFPINSSHQQDLTATAVLSAATMGPKQLSKGLSASSSAAAFVLKAVAKTPLVANAITSAAAIATLTGKSLTATAVTAAASLAAARQYLLSLTATAIVSSVSVANQVQKTLSAASNGAAPTITRISSKMLPAASSSIASLIKQIAKPLVASATAAAVLVYRGIHYLALFAAGVLASSSGILKQVGKPIAAPGSSTADFSAVISRGLFAASSAASSMARLARKSLAAAAESASSIARQLSLTLAAAASSIVELAVRQVSGAVYLVTLTAVTVSTAGTMVRSISKTLNAASAAISLLLARLLRLVRFFKPIPKQLVFAAPVNAPVVIVLAVPPVLKTEAPISAAVVEIQRIPVSLSFEAVIAEAG